MKRDFGARFEYLKFVLTLIDTFLIVSGGGVLVCVDVDADHGEILFVIFFFATPFNFFYAS